MILGLAPDQEDHLPRAQLHFGVSDVDLAVLVGFDGAEAAVQTVDDLPLPGDGGALEVVLEAFASQVIRGGASGHAVQLRVVVAPLVLLPRGVGQSIYWSF